MTNKVYAKIRATSYYAKQIDQSNDEYFEVSINNNLNQLRSGFYIQGGFGGNYRPEDLDFYVIINGKYVLAERNRGVK